MGMSASATLIFGIPVEPFGAEGEGTQHWSEEDDDWRELDSSVLEYRPYGDYVYGSDMRAILALKSAPTFTAYCGDAARLPRVGRGAPPDALYRIQVEADRLGLVVDLAEAGWYLVASYG